MIKALVFDFFGVIGQSTYAYIDEAFKPNADQRLALGDLHRSLDYGFIEKPKFIQQYAEVLKVEIAKISDIFNDADNHFKTSSLLLEYINNNHQKYKIGLLSNVNGESYDKFIKPIVNYFDAVVTSYNEKLAKPDIHIYEIMADKLLLDISECLMIDDSAVNCKGAIAAGMQAIKYTNYDIFVKEIGKYLT